MEALVVVEFGDAFGITDKDYWRAAQTYIADSITTMPSSNIIECFTSLKKNGMLTNEIIKRGVSKLKEELSKLTTTELVQFFVIYTSDAVQSAGIVRDQKVDDKLQYLLTC